MSSTALTNFVADCRSAPTGGAGEWHFEVRYRTERPGFFVFFMHAATLGYREEPISKPIASFFPESNEDLAAEVVPAIISMFTNNPTMPKPRKLVTLEAGFSKALQAALIAAGIPSDVILVQHSPKIAKVLHAKLGQWFVGPTGEREECLPERVRLDGIRPESPFQFHHRGPEPYMRECAGYMEEMENSVDGTQRGTVPISKMMQDSLTYLFARPKPVAKANADRGDAAEQISYAVRLRAGIRCQANRKLSYEYLQKALANSNATDAQRSQAHSVLINWILQRFETNNTLGWYCHFASHHANEAARLGGIKNASGNVMTWAGIAATALQVSPQSKMMVQYPYIKKAYDAHQKQMKKEDNALAAKRLAKPNRYRCGNITCMVETNVGSSMKRCAGKCDDEMKPYYCSVECQHKDWKTHKPFCTPGAKCSVLDKEYLTQPFSGKDNSIQVPVRQQDGSIATVSANPGDFTIEELQERVKHLQGTMTGKPGQNIRLEKGSSRVSA